VLDRGHGLTVFPVYAYCCLFFVLHYTTLNTANKDKLIYIIILTLQSAVVSESYIKKSPMPSRSNARFNLDPANKRWPVDTSAL